MTLDIVYWLIPGYLCLLIYNGTQGIRHQGTWDFLVKLAPASAVCLFAARVTIYYLYLEPEYNIARIGLATDIFGQREISLLVALAFALPIGLFSPPVVNRFFYLIELYRTRLLGSQVSDSPNLLSVKCKTLLGKMIQVSAKSGKVYGAYLLAYSFEDKVPAIKIAPFISGFRKENLTVTFNTLYLKETEHMENMKHRELLIPVNEICSLAELDWDFQLHMIRNGTLNLELSPQQMGEQPKVDTQDSVKT